MVYNLSQALFLFLAVTIFLVGVGVNFFESYLPRVVVQAYRYGRPNIFKERLKIVKLIEVPKRYDEYNVKITSHKV